MKITHRTRVTHSLSVDDNEFELEHAPVDHIDPLVHIAGDKAVVAYLVQDHTPPNPMVDHDSQGTLYTRNTQTITDNDYEFERALGLDGYGNPDTHKRFTFNSKDWCLYELAQNALAPGADDDEIEAKAFELYPKFWRDIAGPYVVPVQYLSQSYDIIRPTSWDGNVNRLPDGVWVADEGAIENMVSTETVAGAPQDSLLPELAVQYAKGVLEEYSNWCNGNVYGCVVELFEQNNGYWAGAADPDLEHSCWGFIGDDYAKSALKEEFFDPMVRKLS